MKLRECKEEFLFFMSILFITSFLSGVFVQNEFGCEYKSIGSRINIGYILGCEITRERWEGLND